MVIRDLAACFLIVGRGLPLQKWFYGTEIANRAFNSWLEAT